MNQISLYKNISSKISITEEEFEKVSQYFHYTTLKKNQNLIKENSFNDKSYFIEKGLLVLYKTLENGEKQVIQFACDDYWISDLYSLITGSKTCLPFRR